MNHLARTQTDIYRQLNRQRLKVLFENRQTNEILTHNRHVNPPFRPYEKRLLLWKTRTGVLVTIWRPRQDNFKDKGEGLRARMSSFFLIANTHNYL